MSELISDEYLEQLIKMRAQSHIPMWGAGGQRHANAVAAIAREFKIKTIVDYGCGHGKLMEALAPLLPGVVMTGYDPGIPERSALPEPAEMLMSTDVLEHIEPDKLEGVLTHVRSLTGRVAYLNIATGPAKAILPDGRNAHLLQRPAAWWDAKLRSYFKSVARVDGFSDGRPSFRCE